MADNPEYIQRVNRAIDHLVSHLSEPLRLDDVAAIACFSPFHFHRIFSSLVGETFTAFLTRLRLERSLALLLHNPELSLTQVALRCGFGSSSNFTRVFKKRYDVAPSQFDLDALREIRRGELVQLAADARLERLTPGEDPDGFPVSFLDLPARTVACIRVTQPYQEGRVRGMDRASVRARHRVLRDRHASAGAALLTGLSTRFHAEVDYGALSARRLAPARMHLMKITAAEQLLRATELDRCELVRGELRMLQWSGARHGQIAATLGSLVGNHASEWGLGAVVAGGTGFWMTRDPDTVRAPDLAFVSAQRAASWSTGYYPGAPDLAAEILEPEDRPDAVQEKVAAWLEGGARTVWVVDPQVRTVTVHGLDDDPRILHEDDTLRGGEVLRGFAVPIREIFA